MAVRKTKNRGGYTTDKLFIIAVSIAMVAGLFYRLPALERLEYIAYDTGVRMTFRNPGAADKIAIIAIDDRSIEQLGQWPWSRSRLAELLGQLSRARPKTISFTIPLFETSANPGLEHIQKLQDYIKKTKLSRQANRGINKLLGQARKDLDADGKLARALTRSKNIILPMHLSLAIANIDKNEAIPKTIARHKLSRIKTDRKNDRTPYTVTQAKYPLEIFAKAANGIGNIQFLRGSDGAVRSEPLVIKNNGGYLPSLALLTAARSLNIRHRSIKAELGSYVQLGKRKIKINKRSVMYPGFYVGDNKQSPFASYSFYDVISGTVPTSSFRNKIVIIGLTATETNNRYPTPVSANMSAPELTANMVTSLLNSDYYERPDWAEVAEYALIGALLIFFLVVFPKINLGTATFVSIVLLILLVTAGQYFMIGQKVWLKTVSPATFLLIGYLFLSMRRLLDTDRIKKIVETDSAQSNRMLGLSFQAQGQLDMAMDKFRKLPVDKSVLDLIYNLSLDYERKRQFNKAVAAYDYILEHNKAFRDVAKRKKRVSQADGALMIGTSQATATGGTLILSGSYQNPTLGRYEVEKELGKGAMGAVYLGRDPKINRVVAIKTLALSEEFEGRELQSVKDRFFREAETAGGLNHPNIVTIYDAGEEHDLAYIAMEFLEGKDLTEYISNKKQCSLEWVLNIVSQVAEALDYAHKQKVVHRDIKPANIMYNNKDDTIKVTDFGIARITAVSNTKTGVVLGTPSYMSPEQLAGERVDGRSDLFSLGVMMYELLSKKQPFSGDSMAALMYQITNTKQEDIAKYRKKLPACIKTIVDKLLQKKPSKRYQSGAEIVLAIQRCANKVL
ncbi:MAG: hypothetical protein BMS9Abin33_0729 [Gammaproteobacteria bacterium]|nr:MAG: hypothetical protein BMS9Abin33_0729 [Gammaproteobacteria bacterium]